jgi:hypothetical protein
MSYNTIDLSLSADATYMLLLAVLDVVVEVFSACIPPEEMEAAAMERTYSPES